MSADTSIRIDRSLKEEFEEKFELAYGVKPQTSSLVEKSIKEKIESIDEELARQAIEAQKKGKK